MCELRFNSDLVLDAVKGVVQNQVEFDRIYYGLFLENPDLYYGMPRPAKWIAKASNSAKKLIRLFSPSVAFVWGIFAPFFFAYRFFRILPECTSKLTDSKYTEKTLALAVCKRSFDVISQYVGKNEQLFWLLPFGQIDFRSDLVKAGSFLSKKDLVYALFSAIFIHYKVLKNQGFVHAIQTYVLFEWFATFIAIDKLSPAAIYTAEHHDRWAILCDLYCKNRHRVEENVAFTIVQHGREYKETYDRMRLDSRVAGLSYKLFCVTQLVVYDLAQAKVFKSEILTTAPPDYEPEVVVFNTSIELTDLFLNGRKILIVGHPICEDFHLKLNKALGVYKDLAVVYKPHPSCDASNDIYSSGLMVIKDKSCFPLVDVVISYPSTLVEEYEEHKVKIFIHPLSIVLEEHDVEISKIIDALFSIV